MGSTDRPLSRAAIREALASVGPMTASELARLLGANFKNVCAQLHHMRRTTTPQIHIAAWTREDGIGKTYLRAVYGAGDMPEARKPRRIGRNECMRRSRARRALPKGLATSVFTWRPQA
jgi:hypothetical protein